MGSDERGRDFIEVQPTMSRLVGPGCIGRTRHLSEKVDEKREIEPTLISRFPGPGWVVQVCLGKFSGKIISNRYSLQYLSSLRLAREHQVQAGQDDDVIKGRPSKRLFTID